MTTSDSSERPKDHRALTNVGGAAVLEGDPQAAQLLAHALDVPPSTDDEEEARANVHGFHSYPARMHPQTARRLVEGLAPPAGTVLDPFCGSGTVLVEARLAGRAVIGVDANPLAARLARLKVRGVDEAARTRLVETARQVAEVADLRRKKRVGSSRRYGPEDVDLFEPHVLLELDGIRVALDELPEELRAVRADLELVLSSILTKVSRRTSDTSERERTRRIAAGYPARLFVRKTEELVERLAAVAAGLAAAPAARVIEGDARRLDGVAPGSIDLVVTSPPYPGVYDYLAHHDARLRWLRLRTGSFEQSEIGARRHLDPLGPDAGGLRWRTQLGAVLEAMAGVLRPGAAAAVLLIADSVVSGAPIYALDVLREIGPKAGLTVKASASQARTHFHGPTAGAFNRRPRREHAILLGPG